MWINDIFFVGKSFIPVSKCFVLVGKMLFTVDITPAIVENCQNTMDKLFMPLKCLLM